MYKGVERDDQRLREKQQRIDDLRRSQAREQELLQLQPAAARPTSTHVI